MQFNKWYICPRQGKESQTSYCGDIEQASRCGQIINQKVSDENLHANKGAEPKRIEVPLILGVVPAQRK